MKDILFAVVISFLLFGCGPSNIEKANELIKLGSFDGAISILNQEIQNSPKNKTAHLALGNAYASYFFKNKSDKDKPESDFSEKAVQSFKSALLIDPNYSEALHNLSDLYLFIGNKKEAKSGFNALTAK